MRSRSEGANFDFPTPVKWSSGVALRRAAAAACSGSRSTSLNTIKCVRQGGASAVKSYGKAAAKQAGRNLYKGAVIPAIDEGIREAGSAM